MDEPNFSEPPPNVSRAWWYDPRTSWHARQQAVRAWHRATRPEDNDRPASKPPQIEVAVRAAKESHLERVAAVELCLEAGWSAEEIVEEMGLKPATILRYLERAGRHDLKGGFNRIVSRERRAA